MDEGKVGVLKFFYNRPQSWRNQSLQHASRQRLYREYGLYMYEVFLVNMIPVLWSFTWVILLDINVTMQISRIPLIPILRFFHEWNLNESVVGQDNFSSRRLWWKPNYIFTNLRILTIAVRPVHLRSQCEIFAKHWRFSGSCKWSPKVMVPSMVRYICLWFLSPLGWLKETKPSKNQSGCTWRNVGQNL